MIINIRGELNEIMKKFIERCEDHEWVDDFGKKHYGCKPTFENFILFLDNDIWRMR